MSDYAAARQRALQTAKGLAGIAEQALSTRAPGGGDFLPGGGGGGLAPVTGGDWDSQRRQRQAYAQLKNWVYAAVNTIAKRLAGQPVAAGELVGASENPERRGYARHSVKGHYWQHAVPTRLRQRAAGSSQQYVQLEDHPVLDLLAQPNSVQGKFEFLYLSCANLLLTGESYWVGGTRGSGENARMEIWSVPTHWVQPKHDKGPFSSYELVTGTGKPVPLKPGNVARTYLPHPSDIKACLSPLQAVLNAVAVDESIQQSQQDMFRRGINPNLIVTVGRNVGPDGKLTDRRPILQPHQRRSLIRSIREVWNNVTNVGDPAILDGMIESVHKLQMTPAEMDWIQSGEVAKRRILQAFGVNPIVMGEIVGSNRAQATEAEKQFCSQGVNPILDALSETLTNYLGPAYTEPKRLLVYVEACEPRDPDLELRRWTAARKQGDVTRDEFRSEQLGLPPGEEAIERNALLSTVGGITGTGQVLSLLAQGMLTREQAKATLMLFLQIDEATADAMVGNRGDDDGTPAALQPPEPPQEPTDDAQDDEGETDEEVDDLPADVATAKPGATKAGKYDGIDLSVTDGMVAEAKRGLEWREEHGRGGTRVGATRANQIIEDGELSPDTWRRVKAYFDRHQSDSDAEGWRPGEDGYPSAGRIAWALWGGDPGWSRAKRVVAQLERADEERKRAPKKARGLKRADIEAFHIKATSRSEEQSAILLARCFRRSVRATADAIEASNEIVAPERAAEQASEWAQRYFDAQAADADLRETALRALLPAFVDGAVSEIKMHKLTVGGQKRTTAEEIADELDIELPQLGEPADSSAPSLWEQVVGWFTGGAAADEVDLAPIGPQPEWVIQAAAATLEETFRQEYWRDVSYTTRTDIQRALEQSIVEGWSVERIARDLNQRFGRSYSLMRGRRVARTEVGNALNAGHVAGMEQIAQETGLRIGKEWVSVMGSTTRSSHARMNGRRTRSPDGLFTLGGVKVPWPGHWSLPARERVNCQCTTISAAVMDNLMEEETPAAAPEPPEPEPDQPPKPKPKELPPVPSFGQLRRKVRNLGGSTGAELWEDRDGNQWVVKTGSSKEHLQSEFLAEELYRRLGVAIPDSRYDARARPPRKISRFVEGELLSNLPGKQRRDAMEKMSEHFAVDAWMANWDVAGLELDNVIVDADGTPWRIDTGGALAYRAQGGDKGRAFGDKVTEIWTMRDPDMNAQTAMMFDKMALKHRAIAEQARKIADEMGKPDSPVALALEDMRNAGIKTDAFRDVQNRLFHRAVHLRDYADTVIMLDDDKFTDDHIDRFTYHQQAMDTEGVFDGLSSELSYAPRYREMGILADEDGRKFDHIRPEKRGDPSVSGAFYDYLRKNVGSSEAVEIYASSQAGDTWAPAALRAKEWFVGRTNRRIKDFYWKKRDRKFKPDASYDDQMSAQHAFTYELLKRLDWENKRDGTITLGRTDSKQAVRGMTAGGSPKSIKRSALDSFSLTHYVQVSNIHTTVQNVPLHRVFYTYLQSLPNSGQTSLWADSEQEFIAMSADLPSYYLGPNKHNNERIERKHTGESK